ncbi:hypothetical protein DMUE_5384 [Dictyocoela muelleri]|nr:hypothetical protein DMUE_5384 [Dictyocoela muelleri]
MLSIFEFFNDDYQKRILKDCKISKSTFQKIKVDLNLFISEKIMHLKNIMLGGQYKVQIDETLKGKDKLLLCPSIKDDNQPGSTYLVGLIEQNSGRMIIEIVPDRKIKRMTKLIRNYVLVETTTITDGYLSYPRAIRNYFCMHKVVILSRGFKNNERYQTNNIENLWSQFNYYVKKD